MANIFSFVFTQDCFQNRRAKKRKTALFRTEKKSRGDEQRTR